MIRCFVVSFRFCCILVAAALAGCAETALVVDQTKRITSGPPGKSTGVYKIGKPYRINGVWYYPGEDYGYSETGIASWYGPAFHGRPTANGEIFDMNALTAAHRTLPMPSMVRVTNLENGRAVVLRVNDRGPFAHGRIIDVSRRAAQLLGFERQGTARVRVEILEAESRALAMAASGGPGAPALANEPKPRAAPSIAVAAETLPPPGGGGGGEPVVETMPVAAPAPAVAPPTRTTALRPQIAEGQVSVQPVRPTQLFIQAGAFTQYHNAYRLSALLSPFGSTEVSSTFVGGQQFFRVRLGPIDSVEEADRLLERVINAGHLDARVIVQ